MKTIKDLPIFSKKDLIKEGEILFQNIESMEPIIKKLIDFDLEQFNNEIPKIKKEIKIIDQESKEIKILINNILKLILSNEGIIHFNNQCLEVSNRYLQLTNDYLNNVNRNTKGQRKLIIIAFIKSSFRYHYYTTKKLKTFYLSRDFLKTYKANENQALDQALDQALENSNLDKLGKEIRKIRDFLDHKRIINLLNDLGKQGQLNSLYLGKQNKNLKINNLKEKERVDKLTYEMVGEILGNEIIDLLNGLFNGLIKDTIDKLKKEFIGIATQEQINNFFDFVKHQLYKDFLKIQNELIRNLDKDNLKEVEKIKIDIAKLYKGVK